MPAIPDFKQTVDPATQFVTLTWACKNPDGSSTLPSGVTIVSSNANGRLGLTLQSLVTNPSSPPISVVPRISTDALSVSAQVGDLVVDRYLLTLILPFSNGDVFPADNHLVVSSPQ